MAVSQEFLDYVLEQLEGLGDLSAKRMFGGAGLWCEGLFFAILVDDILYLKADPSTRDRYRQRGMEPFQPKGRPPGKGVMGYWEVPEDVLEDRDELTVWAGEALEVAARSSRS